MRRFLLFIGVTLCFAMGRAYAQDLPLVRYDEDAFLKVAKSVKQNDYNNMVPWGEKVFSEYFKHKGIKVDFTESDYAAAITAHDTCAASIQKLVNEKNTLLFVKQRLENDLTIQKKITDSLQVMVQTLTRELYLAQNGASRQADRVRDSLVAENNLLAATVKAVEAERNVLQAQLEELQRTNADLKSKNDVLTQTNADLTSRNQSLEQAQEKFAKAFETAEAQIHNSYLANKDKPVSQMNDNELQRALDAYEGIKLLLDFHPLSSTASDELKLITAWKQLKVAMNEAVVYMEGRYNNTTRTACIAKINSAANGVTLGYAQVTERNEILTALNDQATVNARFNELLDYMKDELIVIPTKADAQDALNLINGQTITIEGARKQIVVSPNPTYHKKHWEAMERLRGIMQNAVNKGPGNNLQIEADFQSTLSSIRSIYQ